MMDFEEIYNDLKPKHKIELAMKLNHYVIGKVTLMDITILTAVSIGIVAALSKGTSLAPAAVLAITAGLCAVIEFVRIKARKRKMLQYTLQNSLIEGEATMSLQADNYALWASERPINTTWVNDKFGGHWEWTD